MSFLIGYQTKALANEKVISSKISGWGATHQRAVSEVTVCGQTAGQGAANFVPGLMSGSLSLRGPQDNDPTAGLHKEIADAIGVDDSLYLTILPDTDAVGMPAIFGVGDPTDWAIDASVQDAVGFTLSCASDTSTEMGYVLHAISAETADGNGTAVDRGASPLTPTTHGLVAIMHVTAYAGLTSAAIKIQHSTDNSSWADLVSFTSVTAIGAQRVAVADGTTVNRYLRAVTDVTGTGSVTFLVAAAPR